MTRPADDVGPRTQSIDATTIVLTVVATMLAFPPMSSALFGLSALATSGGGKGGAPAGLVALSVAQFVSPVLGGLLAWAHARHRRYPFPRVWRRTVIGILIPSAVIDLVLLGGLALLLVAGLHGG